MSIQDTLYIFQWWIPFFVVGLLFLPLTAYFFQKFPDKGFIFSKVIGVIIISYTTYFLSTLKIFSFSLSSIYLVTCILFLLQLFLMKKFLVNNFSFAKDLKTVGLFLFEEVLFIVCLIFWAYIKGFQPDIYGLEKYMDFGFINSILRSTTFPPQDMWFPPFPINYYYFGHLVTAVLTKISFLDSFITFNLMLATVFSFTFVGSFSIAASLFHSIRSKNQYLSKNSFFAGFLSAFLITFAGNLHPIYIFFKSYNVNNPVPFWNLPLLLNSIPNAYWYPNATRFIMNTIHEFPIYSFVVSDLHGHVLDIPFVLTAIAFLYSFFLNSCDENNPHKKYSLFDYITGNKSLIFLGFLLSILYMTNAWDGIIYLLLSILLLTTIQIREILYFKKRATILSSLIIVGLRFFSIFIPFVVFSIPFNIHFEPFVSGIGVLCSPEFLARLGKWGPFLFEENHCQKSPLWQLFILYGFFYFWVSSFVFYSIKRISKEVLFSPPFLFIVSLITLATVLIIIPEFIYVKDIYPAHYRANTMFKLVYQSFIMLSISCGFIIYFLFKKIKTKNFSFSEILFQIMYVPISIILLSIVFTYPYYAIHGYFGDLLQYKGLNGISYLERMYPDDYSAIRWLNKNIVGQPIVLEAQGDSYTDYERVSANTGFPTVLGWTVHEWLWRKSYSVPAPRISDVQSLYEDSNLGLTKNLIQKYNIEYIFIGDLERKKYKDLQIDKFNKLGTVVFNKNQTVVYKINK